jgi:hypothetical protein
MLYGLLDGHALRKIGTTHESIGAHEIRQHPGTSRTMILGDEMDRAMGDRRSRHPHARKRIQN